jgi:hypothetical protein
MSQSSLGASNRTTEAMLAELVHHMAEKVRVQQETNKLLQRLISDRHMR